VRITLANLSDGDSAQLLARLMRLAPQRALELAQAVGVLSDGNPFDTIEMVNALRGEGADLLAARLARITPAARDLLSVKSCLGHFVDYALLGAAAGCGDADLRELLREPLEDGLLVAGQSGGLDGIRFRHDRVQQVVHTAIGDKARAQYQLAIARRLAAQPQFQTQAAQQYLAFLGAREAPGNPEALTDASEARRAAQLLHDAARQLSHLASYALAERYLHVAKSLLDGVADEADAKLCIQIDFERHVALYSLGRHAECDAVFESLRLRVSEALDLVDAACLQIRSIEARGDMRASSALGLDMLERLGLHAPPGYVVTDTNARPTALAAWIEHDSRIDYASRPVVQDRCVLAIAKLLVRLTRSAYSLFDMDLATWLMFESQRLWAAHGPCPEMVTNFGGYYGVYVARRQDFRTGYDMCRHALAVGQALGWQPQTSTAHSLFGGFSCHWFEPLEYALQQLEQALDGAWRAGEPVFASQVQPLLTYCLFDLAPGLEVSQAETEKGLALCRQTGNLFGTAMHTGSQLLILALRGLTKSPVSFDDGHFSEQDFLARSGHLPYVNSFAYQHALNALIPGDRATLAKFADAPLPGTAIGNYTVFHMHVIVALARAWQLQDKSAADEAQAADQLARPLQWLQARAGQQAYNFRHLVLFVQAEQAWGLGDFSAAANRFDEALGEVEQRPRPWHRALVAERAGLFHRACGLGYVGWWLLTQALEGYRGWGAAAKVSAMQHAHAFLAPEVRDGAGLERFSRLGGGKGGGKGAARVTAGLEARWAAAAVPTVAATSRPTRWT
jgi:hypothetical protein